MSFLDYLRDNRGQFIDHRATPALLPTSPGTDDLPGAAHPPDDGTGSPAPGALRGGRRRRPRQAPRTVRLRHVRPAFSPSPYSDPLPYEEPWERAFR